MGCLSSAWTTIGVDVLGESWGCTATTLFFPKSQVTPTLTFLSSQHTHSSIILFIFFLEGH